MPLTMGYTGPRPTKYLFIDGPFLEGVVDDFLKPFKLEQRPELNYTALAGGCSRAIYYDALPVQKENQADQEYQKIFSDKHEFLNRLRSLQNFHVRDGYTRNRPKAKNRLEQKGVDTWIAVEALQYALRGLIDYAEIITSDLDLYPLFEALTQTKTRGILRYDKERTTKELIYSADQATPLRQLEIFNLLPTEFKKAHEPKRLDRPITLEEKFDSQDTKLEICEFGYNKELGLFHSINPDRRLAFQATKLKTLIRHINESFGLNLKYKPEFDI